MNENNSGLKQRMSFMVLNPQSFKFNINSNTGITKKSAEKKESGINLPLLFNQKKEGAYKWNEEQAFI